MKRITLIGLALATAFPTNPLKLSLGEDTPTGTGNEKVKKFVEGSKEVARQAGQIVFLGAIAAFCGAMLGLGWRGGNKIADKMGGTSIADGDETMTTAQAGARGGQARQRAA